MLPRVIGTRVSQRRVGLRDLCAATGYRGRQFLRREPHDHCAGLDVVPGVEIDRDHAARYLRCHGRFAHCLDGGFGGISDVRSLIADRMDLQRLLRVAQALSVGLLALSIFSGLAGSQNAYANFNMSGFWIGFVLGFAYLIALFGDLYARLNLTLPASLSDQEKALYQQLAELRK